MKKENLINISLYLLSGLMVWTLAYPSYNGGGFDVLKQSDIMSELVKNTQLKSLFITAKELEKTGQSSAQSYRNIEEFKKDTINKALPPKIDIARTINDFDKMADAKKIKIVDSPKFSKNTNNKKYPNLDTNEFNFSFEGEYLNSRQFLADIENSLQIYNIKSLSFSKVDPRSNIDNYKFSISLEAFELK